MAKEVELRRHTANDGDRLTKDGIRAAVEIGKNLQGGYELIVSSGAQRATQTAACFLAGLSESVDQGVQIDVRFRSEVEDRWFTAYEKGGGGDLPSFIAADPELVEIESKRFSEALKEVFDSLTKDGRALVVGHSPMQEAAVYGLTGKFIEPLAKGAGVVVSEENSSYRVEPLS
jgi:broad specificity phosphatase PhoE